MTPIAKSCKELIQQLPSIPYESITGRAMVTLQREQAADNSTLYCYLLIPIISTLVLPIIAVLGITIEVYKTLEACATLQITKQQLIFLIAHITTFVTIPIFILGQWTGGFGFNVPIVFKDSSSSLGMVSRLDFIHRCLKTQISAQTHFQIAFIKSNLDAHLLSSSEQSQLTELERILYSTTKLPTGIAAINAYIKSDRKDMVPIILSAAIGGDKDLVQLLENSEHITTFQKLILEGGRRLKQLAQSVSGGAVLLKACIQSDLLNFYPQIDFRPFVFQALANKNTQELQACLNMQLFNVNDAFYSDVFKILQQDGFTSVEIIGILIDYASKQNRRNLSLFYHLAVQLEAFKLLQLLIDQKIAYDPLIMGENLNSYHPVDFLIKRYLKGDALSLCALKKLLSQEKIKKIPCESLSLFLNALESSENPSYTLALAQTIFHFNDVLAPKPILRLEIINRQLTPKKKYKPLKATLSNDEKFIDQRHPELKGNTLLEFAVKKENSELLEILLACKVNLSSDGKEDFYLGAALLSSNSLIIQPLFIQEIPEEVLDQALEWMISAILSRQSSQQDKAYSNRLNYFDSLKQLVLKGASNIDLPCSKNPKIGLDRYKNPPLIEAVLSEDIELVNLLLSLGANTYVKAVDPKYNRARVLTLAKSCKDQTIYQTLIKAPERNSASCFSPLRSPSAVNPRNSTERGVASKSLEQLNAEEQMRRFIHYHPPQFAWPKGTE